MSLFLSFGSWHMFLHVLLPRVLSFGSYNITWHVLVSLFLSVGSWHMFLHVVLPSVLSFGSYNITLHVLLSHFLFMCSYYTVYTYCCLVYFDSVAITQFTRIVASCTLILWLANTTRTCRCLYHVNEDCMDYWNV